MSKIVIGKSGKRNVEIDLDTLIRTRLLIQANSGGGKSWLLRLIAEQLFGKIPIHILDPEGEFATLREKFPFVLIGEGGEAAADVRSAGLVAQRLLELRASAVVDLYEAFRSKPGDRRQWVRKYLEALIDAPKKLWRPLVVIVDEAHKFCPQETPKAGSQAEREIIQGCKDAMIALTTVGRKRRFCGIWATQRLAKVDKDASAELLNRLIGPTFEDVDIDRAADMLSVSRDEKADFKKQIRVLEPGTFFAIGRAVSKERVMFKTGHIATSHPDVDTADYNIGPPPTPEKIKALLPKLSDLPKEAEDKARSEAELKKRIRTLEQELTTSKRISQKSDIARSTARAIEKQGADPRAIERATRAQRDADEKQFATLLKNRDLTIIELQRELRSVGEHATLAAKLKPFAAMPKLQPVKVSGGEIHTGGDVPKNANAQEAAMAIRTPTPNPRPDIRRDEKIIRQLAGEQNGDGELTPYHKSVVRGLAELESIGKAEPSYGLVAAAAGRSRSGAWDKAISRLKKLGLVTATGAGALRLTEDGRSAAPDIDAALDAESLQERLRSLLDPYQQSIFDAAVSAQGPIPLDDLANAAGRAQSGAWDKKISSLRKMEILENAGPRTVKVAGWVFLE